jgi:O-antigen/teichoic acid export membrane protein
MQMIGKEKVYQKIILLSLILNITLNLILIPVYGAIGAAIASMISLITWNTISTIYVKKTTGISTFITLKTIPLNE